MVPAVYSTEAYTVKLKVIEVPELKNKNINLE